MPDAGEILLDGKPVHFRSPIDARDAGIETVYQNLALSPALSIADNMFLGRELRKPGCIGTVFRRLDRSRDAARSRASKLSELGLLTIQNINQPVETLSGGQRQGVAVARAAAFGIARRHHGRADGGARRQGDPPRARTDARREAARPADRPDLATTCRMSSRSPTASTSTGSASASRSSIPKDYSMSDAVAIMTGAMKPPEQMAA